MKSLCECKTEKLISILKEFDEATQAELGTVTTLDNDMNPMPETARPSNDSDKLDFILNAWLLATNDLYEELGIDLEGDDE